MMSAECRMENEKKSRQDFCLGRGRGPLPPRGNGLSLPFSQTSPTPPVFSFRILFGFLLLWAFSSAEARVGRSTVYDPPADYYQSAQGLIGAGLKAALHQRIKGHRVLSYGSRGTVPALRVLDAMPGNSSQVRLLYWGTGRAGSRYGGSVGDWNHEHCWPQAYGVDGGAGNADVHNLRPCDVQANGERANLYYAEIANGVAADRSPLCVKTSTAWMPRPEEKGDLARAMFYMAVRYEGGESTPDLELSDTPNAGANRFGRLSDLLRWHREDPVDDEERRRNHLVYTDYQYNRNPFVDDPDYVEMVFRSVPVVRVTAVQAVATEGLEEAVVRISRRGPVTQSLTVPLVYDGTAEPGEWEETPSAVTIPAGAATIDLVLAGRPQSGEQGLRTLLVAAANSAAYAPVDGPAELALLDAPAKGVPQMVTWPVAGPATGGSGADRRRVLGEEITRAARRVVRVGHGPGGRAGWLHGTVVGGGQCRLLISREVMLGEAAIPARVRLAAGTVLAATLLTRAVLTGTVLTGTRFTTILLTGTVSAAAAHMLGLVVVGAVGVEKEQAVHDRAAARRADQRRHREHSK